MVWNSVWPDGSKSVKQNTGPGQQNTTYTEATMNKDHFWNIGTDEDGHHRAINMENYADTAIGAPADAPIATGMDGVLYYKTVNGRVQGFYRNANGIFQYIPSFIQGTILLGGTYQTVTTLPDNCFGTVWFYRTNNSTDAGFGSFKCSAGVCQAFCNQLTIGDSNFDQLPLRFGNGDQASGLNFRARTSAAGNGTYTYKIMFWAT